MVLQVPVYLATMAACGSLVTSVKSGWELSRMVRKKLDENNVDDEARIVHRKLRKAYHAGVMGGREYDKWYETLLLAKAEKDMVAMGKIRAHLRIIWNRHDDVAPSSHRQGHGKHRPEHERRRSVTFDTRRVTIPYVPDPPPRHGDIEWPQSAGSIEYHPMDEKSARSIQLARLQRRSSVSYARSHGSSEGSPKNARETKVEKEAMEEDNRGRSRSREFTRYRGDDSDDEYEHRSRHSRRGRDQSSERDRRRPHRSESVTRYESLSKRGKKHGASSDEDRTPSPVQRERYSRHRERR